MKSNVPLRNALAALSIFAASVTFVLVEALENTNGNIAPLSFVTSSGKAPHNFTTQYQAPTADVTSSSEPSALENDDDSKASASSVTSQHEASLGGLKPPVVTAPISDRVLSAVVTTSSHDSEPSAPSVTSQHETSLGGLKPPVVTAPIGDRVLSAVVTTSSHDSEPSAPSVTSQHETSLGGLKPPVVTAPISDRVLSAGVTASSNDSEPSAPSVTSQHETSLGGLKPPVVTAPIGDRVLSAGVVTTSSNDSEPSAPSVTSQNKTSMNVLEPPVVTTSTGDRLNLTQHFLVDCLRRRARVVLPALDGNFFVDWDQIPLREDAEGFWKNPSNRGEDDEESSDPACTLTMTPTKPDQVLVMRFSVETFFTNDGRLVFGAAQSSPDEQDRPFLSNLLGFVPMNWDHIVTSLPGKKIWFRLEVSWLFNRSSRHVDNRFNFTWVHKSAVPGLESVKVNSTLGYIQTPHFDGSTAGFFTSSDKWGSMHIPVGFVTMVSFAHFPECMFTFVTFSTLPESGYHYGCTQTFPMVFVQKHTVTVQYQKSTEMNMALLGLKIWFTFHEEGTPFPILQPDGKWNCPRDGWGQFQLHFPCNIKVDCLNGLDEAACPYASPRCRHGEFMVDDKCYLFVYEIENRLSWNDADVRCRHRGGRLVSLNTPEEWEAVRSFLVTYQKDQGSHLFVGLKNAPSSLPQIYRQTWQHTDNSIAYYIPQRSYKRKQYTAACVYLTMDIDYFKLETERCDVAIYANYMCERNASTVITTTTTATNATTTKTSVAVEGPKTPPLSATTPIPSTTTTTTLFNSAAFVVCPRRHVTHNFLSCDVKSACWGEACEGASLSPPPPSFSCGDGDHSVPYSLLCDFRSDCTDNSDENFCVHPPCDPTEDFECRNGQCFRYTAVCDDFVDCVDGSDEDLCSMTVYIPMTAVTTPALVRFDVPRAFTLVALNVTDTGMYPACPVDYYTCPSNGYCLPVFTRCNGVHDCPDQSDEAACDGRYTCPGFYRCRGSTVCVAEAEICDHTTHCPERDDELLCDLRCPHSCTCYGLAFFCRHAFRARDFPRLTYLDATGSGMDAADVVNNTMLVHLRLAACGLRETPRLALSYLHYLDLSRNHLTEVSAQHIAHLPHLRNLTLAANPLTSIFSQSAGLSSGLFFPRLHSLDLSAVPMTSLLLSVLDPFTDLRVLNLSGSHVDRLDGAGRDVPASLRALDVRGCPLTYFPADLLRNLSRLQDVWADSYKLCCPQMLPSRFNLANCRAPSDEISSCENLLRSNIYRGCLVLFASMALLGNLAAFVTRLVLRNIKNGFDIFTITLCASDFLMGLYLAIIGVADRRYFGSFLWNDVAWRNSTACKVAGFLSLASNEVSAFIVLLITLDRFLVLRFPFSSVRFTKRSGTLVSCVAWLVGAVLASVPLLPPAAHWTFYSLNGICVPLPVTRKEFPGRRYSFGLLVVLNFVLFVLIAAGQLFIYLSVQKNSLQLSDSTKQAGKDARLARRLLTIVMSDFLCWFPVGLLGMLSSSGIPISGEVNVAMAIFVLPLNSAINPYLYTVNLLLEKRRVRNEQRLVNRLLLRLKQHPAPVQ